MAAATPEVSTNRRGWVVVLIGAVVLTSIGVVVYLARHEEQVAAFVRAAGVWGPLMVLALYFALGFSPIPSEVLTLVLGAVYGPLWGTLLAFTGNMTGALTEYFLGTRIANVTRFEEQRNKLPFGLGRFPAHSLWFQIGVPLTSSAGSKLSGILSGAYRVPLWRFIWTSGVTNLFGAAVVALSGFGLFRLL